MLKYNKMCTQKMIYNVQICTTYSYFWNDFFWIPFPKIFHLNLPFPSSISPITSPRFLGTFFTLSVSGVFASPRDRRKAVSHWFKLSASAAWSPTKRTELEVSWTWQRSFCFLPKVFHSWIFIFTGGCKGVCYARKNTFTCLEKKKRDLDFWSIKKKNKHDFTAVLKKVNPSFSKQKNSMYLAQAKKNNDIQQDIRKNGHIVSKLPDFTVLMLKHEAMTSFRVQLGLP